MTAVAPTVDPREQTRALAPAEVGHVERDGQCVFYEVYGDGDETIFLLPTWSLVHSRHWKMQIPYLAGTTRLATVLFTPSPSSRAPRDAILTDRGDRI